MADMMQFDLVSPEKSLASLQVTSVQIPGAEGDLTAMPGHAPLITTLRPGILKVASPEGDLEFVVTGGFAEIGESLSVLAERALPKAEMTKDTYDALVEEARAAHEAAKEAGHAEPGPVDDAAKLLADVMAMGAEAGLS